MKIVCTLSGGCAVALAFLLLLPLQIRAESTSGHHGFMAGFQSGYGQLHLHSDQREDVNKGTLSMGFRGGYAVSPRMVAGLEIGGWLLEAYGVNDPARGESVSTMLLFIHVFPFDRLPVYLRSAAGHGSYTAHAPDKQGGSAWGAWLLGAGYEIRTNRHFCLAGQIEYGQGSFSDVPDVLGRETGRHYRVIDISLALYWYGGQ